jgi:hypothetical protein
MAKSASVQNFPTLSRYVAYIIKIICFFLEHVWELCAIIFIKEEKGKRMTAYTHTCTCGNAPSNGHLLQCLKPPCNELLLCCLQIETLLELPGHPLLHPVVDLWCTGVSCCRSISDYGRPGSQTISP